MTAAEPQLGATWEEAGLDADTLDRVRGHLLPLAGELELAARVAPYADCAWTGARSAGDPDRCPTLYLDDVSAIPFLVNITGVEEYQHRARVRAGTGDLFAAVSERTPGYEEYCRDRLGLGEPELVRAEPVGGPMEVARACAHGEAFARIVAVARRAGGLAIHPYMGIEWAWELAARVRTEAGVPVSVLGPPPPVTWLANDKAHFSEVVRSVLGPDWVTETRSTRDPEAMGRALLELGERYGRVGLKRTRCASGMGNVHFDRDELRGLGLEEVTARVREFLTRTEWDAQEEVLVVAWEATEDSPSTQMWIPPPAAGPPRLDGIYEQILEGEERVFLGSRPSSLPAPVNRALARSALQVAAALQSLGYVGRCSFDHLVLGDLAGDFEVRFTECNGRWGGTSTPMHLVRRLTGDPRPPYRAQDYAHPGLTGATFPELLARIGDALYDPAAGSGRFVFYNLGPLAEKGKLDVISLGRTQEEAEEAVEVELPRLLGLEG